MVIIAKKKCSKNVSLVIIIVLIYQTKKVQEIRILYIDN